MIIKQATYPTLSKLYLYLTFSTIIAFTSPSLIIFHNVPSIYNTNIYSTNFSSTLQHTSIIPVRISKVLFSACPHFIFSLNNFTAFTCFSPFILLNAVYLYPLIYFQIMFYLHKICSFLLLFILITLFLI